MSENNRFYPARPFDQAELIADPNQGLLILEVKGGQVRKEGGHWYSYDKKLKRPPLKQAQRFRTALLDLFREKNIKPPGIGLALCLPDTLFSNQPTQADLEGLVVGENHLPYLSERFPFLMATIPDFGKPGSGWIKAVHDMWCESWVPQMNLLTRTHTATSSATVSSVLKAWKDRPLL